jgi:hypothetical protein
VAKRALESRWFRLRLRPFAGGVSCTIPVPPIPPNAIPVADPSSNPSAGTVPSLKSTTRCHAVGNAGTTTVTVTSFEVTTLLGAVHTQRYVVPDIAPVSTGVI